MVFFRLRCVLQRGSQQNLRRRHALRVNFNLMVMFRPIRYVDSESFVMEVTYAVTESLHVTENFAFGAALFLFSVFSVLSSFSPIFLQPFHFVFRSVSFFRYFYEFQILTRVFQVFCNSVLIYVFYFLLFFLLHCFLFFFSFFLSFVHFILLSSFFNIQPFSIICINSDSNAVGYVKWFSGRMRHFPLTIHISADQ